MTGQLTDTEVSVLRAKILSAAGKSAAEISDLVATSAMTRDYLYGGNVLDLQVAMHNDLVDLHREFIADKVPSWLR